MKKLSDNPFISKTENGREYLCANCSLNKVHIAKVPVNGIEDELEGLSFQEVFGARRIIEDIKEHANELHIVLDEYKEMDLPKLLDERLVQGSAHAVLLAKKYGYRLGMLLLTLKTGLEENRKARPEWTDSHWDYWANVKNVILTGGLASGYFGKYMVEQAYTVFARAGMKSYNLIRNENGSKTGASGCLTQVEGNSPVHIVFDFGQTKVKRVIFVKEEQTKEARMIELPSFHSINMDVHIDDSNEKYRQAQELHEYLLNIIVETYKEAVSYGEVGWEVAISIANYVIDGRIYDKRGGYAKLAALGDNYAGILASDLEKRLGRSIMVRLIHDATAAALNYKEYEDAVCITLGTAFGVGFPEINLKGRN